MITVDFIVLCGAGNNARIVLNEILSNPDLFCDRIWGFGDIDSKKVGEHIQNFEIHYYSDISPEKIKLYVITTFCTQEISDYLSSIGIPSNKIVTFDEYKRICYSQRVYRNRYGHYLTRQKVFDTKSLVVYTALTGNYDNLNNPLFVDGNLTYVCFTNNGSLKSDIWNVEYIKDDTLNNVLLAKKYKFHPEYYFSEYETSIWADAKFLIRDDLREYVTAYEKSSTMLCFPHFMRRCVYDEAIECFQTGKTSKEATLKQISCYYGDSYPIDNGLFEMGCIVRNHNDEQVIRLMNSWENQIQKFTYRDQISFPYVCWKAGFTPDISDLYIENNRWLKCMKHNTNV